MSRDIDTKINLQTCFLIECCTGLLQFLLLKLQQSDIQCENPEAIVCLLSAPEISSWFFFKEYAELLICSIVSNFLESNWKKCVVTSLQSSLTIWRTSYFFISEQRGKKKTEDLIFFFSDKTFNRLRYYLYVDFLFRVSVKWWTHTVFWNENVIRSFNLGCIH